MEYHLDEGRIGSMAIRSVLYLSILAMAVTCSVASISTSPADAQLKVINPTGAPASLSSVAIQNDTGREISLIHYKILNRTKRRLNSVMLKLVFFDSWGKPLGGEAFSEQMVLRGSRHAEFVTPIKQYVGPGVARVVIVLSAVETDKDTWRDDSASKPLLEETDE